jgi:hypothetical protein
VELLEAAIPIAAQHSTAPHHYPQHPKATRYFTHAPRIRCIATLRIRSVYVHRTSPQCTLQRASLEHAQLARSSHQELAIQLAPSTKLLKPDLKPRTTTLLCAPQLLFEKPQTSRRKHDALRRVQVPELHRYLWPMVSRPLQSLSPFSRQAVHLQRPVVALVRAPSMFDVATWRH